MLKSGAWRIGSMALLVAALTFGAAGLANTFSPATSVAFASPVAGGNDNDDGDQDNDEEANEIEGQILRVVCPLERGSDPAVAAVCADLSTGSVIPAINREPDPPDMYVHTLDGAVRVIVRDRARLDQVAECNYVSVDGERIHTFLFEGQDIEVQDFSGCRNDNED